MRRFHGWVLGVLVTLTTPASAFGQDQDPEPERKEPDADGRSFDPFGVDEEQEEQGGDALPSGDAEDFREPVSAPATTDDLPIDAASHDAPPPDAASTVVVVIPTDPASADVCLGLGSEASKRLADARSVQRVNLERLVDPGLERRRKEAVAAAKHDIETALRQFEELDLESAAEGLDDGVEALAAHFEHLNDESRRLLYRALFTHGTTLLYDGHSELADADFVALTLLAPHYRPSPDLYPSNVVTRFEQVVASIDDRPTGTLSVQTNPPGAAVWVDGSRRGSSPVDVGGLTDGNHLIVVSRLGFTPVASVDAVLGEQASTVQLELELVQEVSDSLRDLDPLLASDVPSALRVARAWGVTTAAFLKLEGGLSTTRVEGLFVDPTTGEVLGHIPSTVVVEDAEVGGQTIAEAILASLAPKLVAGPPPPEPITEAWWFWAAVGGAVIVVASATAIAVSASGGSGPPDRSGLVLF